MKIDIDAFMDSLPIMGIGLLGIFIVTIVIIAGIYILRALTAGKSESDKSNDEDAAMVSEAADPNAPKESAMDLMEEREKKDFLETDDTLYISKDL